MTDEVFKGRYEINDGYVGGSRPQFFSIPAGFLEDNMDDEALAIWYEEYAQECFEQNVSISTSRTTDFISWAREQFAKRKDAA